MLERQKDVGGGGGGGVIGLFMQSASHDVVPFPLCRVLVLAPFNSSPVCTLQSGMHIHSWPASILRVGRADGLGLFSSSQTRILHHIFLPPSLPPFVVTVPFPFFRSYSWPPAPWGGRRGRGRRLWMPSSFLPPLITIARRPKSGRPTERRRRGCEGCEGHSPLLPFPPPLSGLLLRHSQLEPFSSTLSTMAAATISSPPPLPRSRKKGRKEEALAELEKGKTHPCTLLRGQAEPTTAMAVCWLDCVLSRRGSFHFLPPPPTLILHFPKPPPSLLCFLLLLFLFPLPAQSPSSFSSSPPLIFPVSFLPCPFPFKPPLP